MKNKYILLNSAAGAIVILFGGCSKQEPSTSTYVNPTAQNAAAPLANAAESLIASQKLMVAQTATNQLQKLALATTNQIQALGLPGTNQAQSAALSVTNQVQALIEKAKGLVSNEKYQDALNTVEQLYTTKLTPDQQKIVDGLRTQIQTAAKATATNANSVLGGILGGKK